MGKHDTRPRLWPRKDTSARSARRRVSTSIKVRYQSMPGPRRTKIHTDKERGGAHGSKTWSKEMVQSVKHQSPLPVACPEYARKKMSTWARRARQYSESAS